MSAAASGGGGWLTGTRARWVEWLLVAAIGLSVLAWSQIPYAWAVRSDRLGHTEGVVFTGAVPTYADDATTYWTWMRQAAEGRFFFTDLHTPDPHPRNYVNLLFWSMGTVARFTGLPLTVVYNAARVAFGLLLLGCLYLLACRLFARPGPRVACFLLMALAGGWEGAGGWLERNMEWGHVTSPAWWTPEMSTFFSLMLFPHFLAGFAAMIAIILLMMRAWTPPAGSSGRGAAVLAGLGLSILTCFHPYDTVSTLGVVWSAPVLLGLAERRWPRAELAASGLATLVWLPTFAYNYYIFSTNPAMRAWDLQNIMITPEFDRLAVAFGINGALAVIALLAFRRLDRDHLVMAAWLLSSLLIINLPLRFQRRMMGGMQFPVGALAAAALALVIVPAVIRLARRRSAAGAAGVSGAASGTPARAGGGWGVLAAAALLLPLNVLTPYYLMDIEWNQLMRHDYPAWLQDEEVEAFQLLERRGPAEAVVLASYEMGNYLPYYTGLRCYVGHYALTIDAKAKEAEVERFFAAGPEADPWRQEILRRWEVAYVLFGRFERELGPFDPATRPWLQEVIRVGEDPGRQVIVYAVRLPEAAAASAAASTAASCIPRA